MKQIVQLAKDRKDASTRSISKQIETFSQTSMCRAVKESGLKPYHTRRSSRVTNQHILKRLRFARYMLRYFGNNPLTAAGIRLTKLVNYDFSKPFRLYPFPNTKNEVV